MTRAEVQARARAAVRPPGLEDAEHVAHVHLLAHRHLSTQWFVRAPKTICMGDGHGASAGDDSRVRDHPGFDRSHPFARVRTEVETAVAGAVGRDRSQEGTEDRRTRLHRPLPPWASSGDSTRDALRRRDRGPR